MLENFKNNAHIKYKNILEELRITNHSTRKTGVKLYQLLGLDEQQIKTFTGHSEKSKQIQEVYGKETEAQKIGSIFEIAQKYQ